MRLPDALLVRPDGNQRQTTRNGRLYVALASWTKPEEAEAAAFGIRAAGGRARVTQERRPLRAYGVAERSARTYRRPREQTYQWIVWAASEKPACAGQMEGAAE